MTTITPCPPLPTAPCPHCLQLQGLGWLGRQQGLSSCLAVPQPSSSNVLVMGGKQGRGKCQDALKQKF